MDADMKFLRVLFEDPHLPKKGLERKLYIDLLFDEYFSIARFDKEAFQKCGFFQQTVHSTLDLTGVENLRGLMDVYIAAKIGQVFPGTSFNDFAMQPRHVLRMMIEAAESENGRSAVAENQAGRQLNQLLGKK